MNVYPNDDPEWKRQPGDGNRWYIGVALMAVSATLVVTCAYYLARWIGN